MRLNGFLTVHGTVDERCDWVIRFHSEEELGFSGYKEVA